MNQDNAEVPELLARAKALHDQAAALTDRKRPFVVRLWNAAPAYDLNCQARDLLVEIAMRARLPDIPPPVETIGGKTRAQWQRMQWAAGILSAFSTIWSLDQELWFTAALSAAGMVLCTRWVLPRAANKTKELNVRM